MCRRLSGVVGRRPSVPPNRNALKVKGPLLWTTQTVMGNRKHLPRGGKRNAALV